MSKDEGQIGNKRHSTELCEDVKTWAKGPGTKVTRTERYGSRRSCPRVLVGALYKGAVKDAEQLWKEGDPTQMCENFPDWTGED